MNSIGVGTMDEDCDDDQLIDDARQGSQRAFTRLVECNQDKLFAAMLRYLRCREDAEEAVQEAFVRAFARLNSFHRDAKFSTWLYRIAFNAAMTGRRKHRPGLSLDEKLENAGFEPVDVRSEGSDQSLLRNEDIELVHKALDSLSDNHRAILVLRELDDLAYEEIADVLGISIGTVRSRISRARGHLREAVESLQQNVIRSQR